MDFGAILNAALKLGSNSRGVSFSVENRQFEAVLPEDSVFFSMKDILFNREYEYFSKFQLSSQREIVVDAGAHAGLYSLIASIEAEKVLALEPDTNIFEILSANVVRNNLGNIALKKSALWIQDGPVEFYRRGNSQLGTVMRCRDSAPFLVNAVSLKRLLEETSANDNDRKIELLKLDIEGAEFDVIPDSKQEILDRISRIVAEVHTVHGRIQTLTNKLNKCGFSYVVVKRPFRKVGAGQIQIIDDYGTKLLMKAVNIAMDLSGYSDWSSLLLFASKESDDFPRSELSPLKERIVETSIG